MRSVSFVRLFLAARLSPPVFGFRFGRRDGNGLENKEGRKTDPARPDVVTTSWTGAHIARIRQKGKRKKAETRGAPAESGQG